MGTKKECSQKLVLGGVIHATYGVLAVYWWNLGKVLFQNHENLEHPTMIESVLESLRRDMIQKTTRGFEVSFRHGSQLNWPEGVKSRETIRAVQKLKHVKVLISWHVNSSNSCIFIDQLYILLRFDPS